MAGLVPAISVWDTGRKSWMPGASPGMTLLIDRGIPDILL
jgi:hypothetical protein